MTIHKKLSIQLFLMSQCHNLEINKRRNKCFEFLKSMLWFKIVDQYSDEVRKGYRKVVTIYDNSKINLP